MRYTKGDHLECYKDLDIPNEWDNESWHNDLVARFHYKQYMIWIDYPKDHERYEEKGSHFQDKYLVEIWYGDDMNKASEMGFDFPSENAFSCETFDELLNWMNSPIKDTNVKLIGCGYNDSEIGEIVKAYNEENKIEVNAKTLDTINDEIGEILEVFLQNISYDINDYDAKFDMDYNNQICIKEIDLNQDNGKFMQDLKEIMNKHFKLNKHKQ